jgi:Phage phiEco32-like COOH.NH2 ligase-type 2
MIYENIKLGCDPELFLVDNTGKFISSIGKIGGSKEYPLPIDDLGNALQEDNVAVEFNIAPASSFDAFYENINKVLTELEARVAKMNLNLAIVPSAEFDWDQLQDEAAMVFGCEPDFNAWTGEVNPHPGCENLQLRSAGGHIHIGYDNSNQQNQMNLVRAVDIFVGVAGILYDTDERRRLLYGKPGAFRPKSYGVECRSPSNFWIKSKEMQEWAYKQTMKAISYLNAGASVAIEDHVPVHNAIMKKDANAFNYLKEKYAF